MSEVLDIPSRGQNGSIIRMDVANSPAIRLDRPVSLTSEPPAGITVEPNESSLTERAVLLRLSMTAWGVNRKLKEHQYEVDANKRMTRACKKLLISPELQAIYSLDNACGDWVASRSLPSQFKRGIYLQPVANLVEVDDHIVTYIQRREGLIDTFIKAYPDRVLEARLHLRSLFDSRNYPPVEMLPERFSVVHEYLELVSAPGSLKAISGELFKREQEKIERRWEEALEEARAVLRAQLAGLVDHMVDRLTPGEDGKPRVFRDTLVSGFEDWLSTFSARNLTDDSELEELVERAKALLRPGNGSIVSAGSLRSDAALRTHLQGSFNALRQRLDGMVMDRPSRRIRLAE